MTLRMPQFIPVRVGILAFSFELVLLVAQISVNISPTTSDAFKGTLTLIF
jgi:hypothetical protein